MENYLPVKIYTKEINQEDTKLALQRLFSIFPKEDIHFELTNNGLVIYLRELDFFNFKKIFSHSPKIQMAMSIKY